MATLFATILNKVSGLQDNLSDTQCTAIQICVALLLSLAIRYFLFRPDKNLDDEFKRIKKEWRLLKSLLDDVRNVLNLGSHIDGEACKLWQTEGHNQDKTARLQDSERKWWENNEKLAIEVDCLIESIKLGAEIETWSRKEIEVVKSKIEGCFNEKKQKANDIYVTLERLRSKIRNLQVRDVNGTPVDEKKADEDKKSKQFIHDLIDRVRTVEQLILNEQKEDKQIADLWDNIKAEIQSLTLHLALMRAFLTDLHMFGLETEIEKSWLKEAKEIIDEAQPAIEKFQKTRVQQGIFSCLTRTPRTWMKICEEMKAINNGFSDLYERKKKCGFKVIRTFIRSETDPSNSIPGSPRGQASKTQTSEDDLDLVCDERELEKKYLLQFQRHGEELEKLCLRFNAVNRKFEEAKYIEGINSSTDERLKQMKKLAKRTLDSLNENKYSSKEIKQIGVALNLLGEIIEVYSIELKEDTAIVGLNEDIQKLASQLKYGSERVVVIVGMMGIGKTNLAKKIYEHGDIVKHFTTRVWVSVRQTYNDDTFPKHVAMRILNEKGSEEEQNGRNYRIEEVYEFLRNRKYLLVLDNFTSENAFETLELSLPRTEGSRILLTTRNRFVTRKVGRCKVHELSLRTKEESWRLFNQMVNFWSPPEDVKKIKKHMEKVVDRCGGLPLPILYFGYLISGKDMKDPKLLEWLPNRYPHQKPWLAYLKIESEGSAIDLTKWLESQKIESEDFPSHNCVDRRNWTDNLCKFFSFVNHFAGDRVIPARRLTALCVAEGLIKEQNETLKTPKDVAMDYFSELIKLNLIQAVEKNINGKVKTCRLPSALVKLKFQYKSSIKILADYFDKDSESFNDIHGNGTTSPTLLQSYKNLNYYLSFDTREGNNPGEDIRKFLQNGIANSCFQSLKVLDLEHVFRPQLPSTIGKLVQLMYLGLRWTYLEEIPQSIGDLLNLQTLDVKYTYVRTLPKSIWKLKNLRYLYLNESHRSQFMSQTRSSSLKNLQILWGLFLDDFSAIKNGLNKLNNLTKLGLAFQLDLAQQGELFNWVKDQKDLKSLRLRSVDEDGVAQDLHLEDLSKLKDLTSLYLFGKLENQSIKSLFPDPSYFHLSDLTLSALGLKHDPMPTLGSLSSLKSLCFYFDSYKGKQMVCNEKSFSQLQVLKLWNLQDLDELKVEEGAMQKLREIDIRCCKKLKVPNGLKHLTSLQELNLTDMPKNFTTTIKEKKWEIWNDLAYPPRIMEDNCQS